jgi:sigma-B regulation protein RsbU (phosphoserine phosphatase)
MPGERTDSSSVSREAATIIQGPGRAVKGKTMLRFNVTAADGALWEHQVAEDEVVIGRSSKAGLTVPDRSLSRAHARIFRTDDGWRLEDLGSRNGTFLNGQRLEGSVPIKVGDTLTLGSSLISLMAVGTDPSDDTADDLSGHTVLRPARELLDRTQLELPAPTAGRRDDLERAAARLHVLNAVNQALGHSIDLQELLELILDRVFDHLKPEEGAIFLREGNDYRRAAARSLSASSRGFWSRSLLEEVVEGSQAALVLDTQADERFNQAQSLMLSGVRSVLAAPLLDQDRALGMIALLSKHGARVFSEDDMELLVSLASVAAMRIANVRLAEEAAQRRILEKEVALGRRIQVALLPATLPEVPGWELWAGNQPSRGVSGDFYKVFAHGSEDRLGVLVADVSGKGIAASLLTGSLEALSAGPLERGEPLDDICASVSRLLHQRTPPEKYSTLFVASVDVATGDVEYVNAGHNPGLILRLSGAHEWLSATGMPVGLLPGAEYTVGRVQLGPRDTLSVYTDGLTEATNDRDEEFGEERLRAECLRLRLQPLEVFASRLEDTITEFCRGVPFADDRTMVLVRRSPE